MRYVDELLFRHAAVLVGVEPLETLVGRLGIAEASAERHAEPARPALHVAGMKDETAPYEKQRKLMDALRALNGCAAKGQTWHKLGTIYPSEGGTPFVELVHPGGHEFWVEAPKLMVNFFKEFKK